MPRYKRKKIILFRYTSALGDALFLTTLAREIKKRNPSAEIEVITGLPQLFERNPDVTIVTKEPEKPVPGLGRYLVHYEKNAPWKKHILNYCANCVDIHDQIELRTYIFPSEVDFQWADELINKKPGPVILINRLAGPRTDKKNWPSHYWEKLIPELLKVGYVIDIGTLHSENVAQYAENYLNLIGKTTIHQTAALMSKASLLICPVTGSLHLASAYDLPTLCILGGSEPAIGTRYKNTYYIENRPPCADCYEKGPCMNNFICLSEIHPQLVINKVKEILMK